MGYRSVGIGGLMPQIKDESFHVVEVWLNNLFSGIMNTLGIQQKQL